MQDQAEIWDDVDRLSGDFVALADSVWETPETCYMEEASAGAHRVQLASQGFRVMAGVADIPTAMIGEAGAGGPVIAFLGEFDALPGLSQEAGVAEQRPIVAGGNGHGCGHNLLGAGAMLAAAAVKDWLVKKKLPGTVRYYGCPAEEGGAAKGFMVKAGLFDDVDMAITWHPGAVAQVWTANTLANTYIDFFFEGRSAHASGSPHRGRSALDAVELMNVGANYLREHMPSDARVSYAILNAGGTAPNVVQANASVRYAIRAGNLSEMLELVERVKKIASGASLMTETTVKSEVISGMANYVSSGVLGDLMGDKIEELGAPHFDSEDHAFAKAIQATLTSEDLSIARRRYRIDPQASRPLAEFLMPRSQQQNNSIMVSTDVADVSWVVPTVQMIGATYAIGTSLHSWQAVAQGKSPAAHKGMIHAAKIMAATAMEACANPAIIAEAKSAHSKVAGKSNYKSPIPDGTMPPISAMSR